MKDLIADVIYLACNILLRVVVSTGDGTPPDHDRIVDVRDGRTSAVLAETWRPLKVTHNLFAI